MVPLPWVCCWREVRRGINHDDVALVLLYSVDSRFSYFALNTLRESAFNGEFPSDIGVQLQASRLLSRRRGT